MKKIAFSLATFAVISMFGATSEASDLSRFLHGIFGSAHHVAADNHYRHHADLQHHAIDRQIRHHQLHHYPMIPWQHRSLHQQLNHEAWHDQLEHFDAHNTGAYYPYGNRFGLSIGFGY